MLLHGWSLQFFKSAWLLYVKLDRLVIKIRWYFLRVHVYQFGHDLCYLFKFMQWEISLSLALLWILTQLWIFCLFFVGQSTCNSSYPPSREYSDYPHSHQGYFPMQPVYHPANQHGSALYTAAYTRDALIANTHNSGSAYSSQSHSHSQPPSHHRSYTPTSSRSGKSTRSNNSTSVTYSQGTDKIALPINL